MSYQGEQIRIPLGIDGLRTDEPHTSLPATALTEAKNVWFLNGKLERDGGSRRWNSAALSTGVVALHDWWPSSVQQRMIALDRAGKVWRYETSSAVVEVTATGSAPTTLIDATEQAQFLECGEEEQGDEPKLVLFSARNSPQVIVADGTTRRNITTPAADWSTGDQPVSGVLHRGRVYALKGHVAYASDSDDHEVFSGGNSRIYTIYPGEGDELVKAYVYKTRLFFFKRPAGVYYLDDSDPDEDNWGVRRFNGQFGLSGPHGLVETPDDLVCKNREGSLTSMVAVQQFGDVAAADLLKRLKVKKAVTQNNLLQGIEASHALYYSDKQLLMVTYRSTEALHSDRVLYVDLNGDQPRVSLNHKDQPNCLVLRRDIYGIQRPFYGAEDGYIYEMDREDRDVAGSTYPSVWRTPSVDFGFAGAQLAEKEKRFDFLELVFEEIGDWNVDIEYWIDRRKVQETLSFDQSLASDTELTADDYLQELGITPRSIRLPLHGQGRRIMFRGSNSGLRQNFKLLALVVYFQPMGQDTKDE